MPISCEFLGDLLLQEPKIWLQSGLVFYTLKNQHKHLPFSAPSLLRHLKRMSTSPSMDHIMEAELNELANILVDGGRTSGNPIRSSKRISDTKKEN